MAPFCGLMIHYRREGGIGQEGGHGIIEKNLECLLTLSGFYDKFSQIIYTYGESNEYRDVK
jgi:hypothetical protein